MVSWCGLKKKEKKVPIIVAFHFMKRRLKTAGHGLVSYLKTNKLNKNIKTRSSNTSIKTVISPTFHILLGCSTVHIIFEVKKVIFGFVLMVSYEYLFFDTDSETLL